MCLQRHFCWDGTRFHEFVLLNPIFLVWKLLRYSLRITTRNFFLQYFEVRERNRTCNFVWFFARFTCFHFQKRCPIQDVRTFLSVHWISAAHVTEEMFVEKSYYMCEVLRKKKGIGSRSHWGPWVWLLHKGSPDFCKKDRLPYLKIIWDATGD